MLGLVRKTTRTDVGLALASTGLAYLAWVIVTGVARHVVNQLALLAEAREMALPGLASALCGSFVHGAAVWDLVGVLWLLVSLVLIVGSGRQQWTISWPWFSSILHGLTAALLGAWTSLAAIGPFMAVVPAPPPAPAVGYGSYSALLALGLVLWVSTLVWMLYMRSRLGLGPSLLDGQRTHRP